MNLFSRVFLFSAISCFHESLHAKNRKSSNKPFNQGYFFYKLIAKVNIIYILKNTSFQQEKQDCFFNSSKDKQIRLRSKYSVKYCAIYLINRLNGKPRLPNERLNTETKSRRKNYFGTPTYNNELIIFTKTKHNSTSKK